MTRTILIAFALFAVVGPARAFADDPTPPAPTPAPAPAPAPAPPTQEQLDKAKKAFGEGKKAFESGDFPEAISKFKESYSLSKNPVLLYNIAFANESAGMKDLALFYYRKFLTDAPADAPQRGEVTDKVKAIEKEFDPNAGKPEREKPQRRDPKKPIVIKPPGTYQASDFQHLVIETAPPAKPLDITASVPDDSGFEVTLYFRTAGEGKFTSKVMKWRYKEMVARIPAPKMIGTSVQYYIECKDAAGTVVTRSGKSTSPNLINLEAGAEPRFYPDLGDDGELHDTTADVLQNDLDEDPLHKNVKRPTPKEKEPEVVKPIVPLGPQDGFMDVGSTKFTYAKWGTTAGAVALVGLSVTFYMMAGKQATALQDDVSTCGTPPCQKFDSYDADLQKAGKRDQTISKVTLGFGLATAAVSAFFWYKEARAEHKGDVQLGGTAGKHTDDTAQSWVVAPMVGPADGTSGFSAGATAAVRF